jgi:hypothetical protein
VIIESEEEMADGMEDNEHVRLLKQKKEELRKKKEQQLKNKESIQVRYKESIQVHVCYLRNEAYNVFLDEGSKKELARKLHQCAKSALMI